MPVLSGAEFSAEQSTRGGPETDFSDAVSGALSALWAAADGELHGGGDQRAFACEAAEGAPDGERAAELDGAGKGVAATEGDTDAGDE